MYISLEKDTDGSVVQRQCDCQQLKTFKGSSVIKSHMSEMTFTFYFRKYIFFEAD